MGFDYIRRQYNCDCCSTIISSSCEYSVDHPTDPEQYDEYCKACFTELGGKYWSGDWDKAGNRITLEAEV